jgi:uncharacterized protein YkwD
MKTTTRRDLFCIALSLLSALWILPRLASADGPPDLTQIEKNVEKGINAHRKATGRPIFGSNSLVAEIARGHSQDMANGKAGFGHDGLSARVAQTQKQLEIAGAAENVSKHQRVSDHAEAAVSKWLNSPVHLKNIDSDYDLSGVGAAMSENGIVYITQIFVKLRSE